MIADPALSSAIRKFPEKNSGACTSLASGIISALTGAVGTTPVKPDKARDAAKKLVAIDFLALDIQPLLCSSLMARGCVAHVRLLVATWPAFFSCGICPPAKARLAAGFIAAAPAPHIKTTKTGRYMRVCGFAGQGLMVSVLFLLRTSSQGCVLEFFSYIS